MPGIYTVHIYLGTIVNKDHRDHDILRDTDTILCGKMLQLLPHLKEIFSSGHSRLRSRVTGASDCSPEALMRRGASMRVALSEEARAACAGSHSAVRLTVVRRLHE